MSDWPSSVRSASYNYGYYLRARLAVPLGVLGEVRVKEVFALSCDIVWRVVLEA